MYALYHQRVAHNPVELSDTYILLICSIYAEVICKPLSQKNSVKGCLQLWYHVMILKYKLCFSQAQPIWFFMYLLSSLFLNYQK